MHNFSNAPTFKDKLFMLTGVVVGGGLTWLIISNLPIHQATLLSAMGLASLVILCAYTSNQMLWWMGVGAIAGMLVGLGGLMAGHLAKEKEPIDLSLRLTIVVTQGMAGFISGVILGRKVQKTHLPTLREFLSSLSALTVGLYAVIVTIDFVVESLEPARSLSSRLSTSTTILVTLLALPGTIGYLLAKRRFKQKP